MCSLCYIYFFNYFRSICLKTFTLVKGNRKINIVELSHQTNIKENNKNDHQKCQIHNY